MLRLQTDQGEYLQIAPINVTLDLCLQHLLQLLVVEELAANCHEVEQIDDVLVDELAEGVGHEALVFAFDHHAEEQLQVGILYSVVHVSIERLELRDLVVNYRNLVFATRALLLHSLDLLCAQLPELDEQVVKVLHIGALFVEKHGVSGPV